MTFRFIERCDAALVCFPDIDGLRDVVIDRIQALAIV